MVLLCWLHSQTRAMCQPSQRKSWISSFQWYSLEITRYTAWCLWKNIKILLIRVGYCYLFSSAFKIKEFSTLLLYHWIFFSFFAWDILCSNKTKLYHYSIQIICSTRKQICPEDQSSPSNNSGLRCKTRKRFFSEIQYNEDKKINGLAIHILNFGDTATGDFAFSGCLT